MGEKEDSFNGAADLANVIHNSAQNVKNIARDMPFLKRLLATLKGTIWTLVGHICFCVRRGSSHPKSFCFAPAVVSAIDPSSGRLSA